MFMFCGLVLVELIFAIYITVYAVVTLIKYIIRLLSDVENNKNKKC